MRRNFTKYEEDFIRENYYKLGSKEIANALDRTRASIKCKARKLNIERPCSIEDSNTDCIDGEVWKDVPNYNGYYKASNIGRVRSVNRLDMLGRLCKGVMLKPYIDEDGYERITLQNDGKSIFIGVHKVVAMTFLENPKNYNQINHKDENKLNNRVDNLEWCDSKYNMNYGTKLERTAKSRSKPVIMKDEDGNFVRRFDSLTQVENELGFCSAHIGWACREYEGLAHGYRWNWMYNSLTKRADGTSYFKGLSKKQWRDRYGEQ